MKTVHVAGDSISMHYGPYLEKALGCDYLYSRKEGDIGNLDIPAGANGGDSSMVLQYLKWLSGKKYHSDFLVLNCGLHDVKRYPGMEIAQVTPENYQKNVESIALSAANLCTTVLWVSSTPVDDQIHRNALKDFYRLNNDVILYNSISDRIMKNNGIDVIDLYSYTLNLGKDLYCDHVHFNESVRKMQGAFIATAIKGL